MADKSSGGTGNGRRPVNRASGHPFRNGQRPAPRRSQQPQGHGIAHDDELDDDTSDPEAAGDDEAGGSWAREAAGAVVGRRATAAVAAARSGNLEGAATQAALAAGQTAAKAVAAKLLIVLAPVLAVIALVALLAGLVFMMVGSMSGNDAEASAAAVAAAQESGVPNETFGAYMEAGREHGVPWEVIAAIAHVQTNHGINAPDGQTRTVEDVAPIVEPPIVVDHGDSTYAGTLLVDTETLDEDTAQSVLLSSLEVAEELAANLRADPAWLPGTMLDGPGDVWVRAIDELPVRGLGDSDPVTPPEGSEPVHLPTGAAAGEVSADRVYSLALAWFSGQVELGCGLAGDDWVTLPTSGPINVGDLLHDGSVLTDEMMGNAQQIVAVGRDLDVADRGLVIAIATALVESRLINIDYGDRDSLGLFQQRPSMGWGTPEEVMDPVHASTRFYEGLLGLEGWETMPPGDAAQAVQRSAHPDRYALWISDSAGIVASASGALDTSAATVATEEVDAETSDEDGTETTSTSTEDDAETTSTTSGQERTVSAGCDATATIETDGTEVSPGPVVANVELAEVAAPGGGSIQVAASIAQPLAEMLDAASADGVMLHGSGWRDTQRQIELREAHCADVWTAPASSCNPPTAIPGRSQHEVGLAIDFVCGGQSMSTRQSPCFVWLDEHAASYGFYNLPSEPWHWSTTGR